MYKIVLFTIQIALGLKNYEKKTIESYTTRVLNVENSTVWLHSHTTGTIWCAMSGKVVHITFVFFIVI